MGSLHLAMFELLSDILDEATTGADTCFVNQAIELLNHFCVFILLFLEEASLTSRCFFPRS